MKLYGYWRSSASYRVRIALNLKEIEAEHIPINLKTGEHGNDDYANINAQRLVPTLELFDGSRITQSSAIIEYLDEAYPQRLLIPDNPFKRSQVRAAIAALGSDTAPIQNLRVLKYLRNPLDCNDAQVNEWARHWIATGLQNLESIAAGSSTVFALTDTPSALECFLIPQIYNARRFKVDMSILPRLREIEDLCLCLPAFENAAPERQADAPV